jgi:hypothetical protein
MPFRAPNPRPPSLDEADIELPPLPPAAPRRWPPRADQGAGTGPVAKRTRKLALALGRASLLLLAAAITAALVLLSPVGTRRLARETAEREMQSLLDATEQERARAFASQRRPADLWRRSHGLLVVTSERLLYIGAAPLTLLRPADPGPRDLYLESWPWDGAVDLQVEQPGERIALRVRAPGRDMRYEVDVRHDAERLQTAAVAARTQRRGELERLQEADRPRPRVERYVPHVVQRGETLSALAVRYRTTVPVLRQLNGLRDENLRAGQRLRVPEPPATLDDDSLTAPAPAQR